jgi:hypothetical protein
MHLSLSLIKNDHFLTFAMTLRCDITDYRQLATTELYAAQNIRHLNRI